MTGVQTCALPIWRRAAAGQGDLFLAAASYNAVRPDMLLLQQTGGRLLRGPWRDLWSRPAGGIALGSMGAALVVEAAEHARARGARPLARLSAVTHGWSDRTPGAAAAAPGVRSDQPCVTADSRASGRAPRARACSAASTTSAAPMLPSAMPPAGRDHRSRHGPRSSRPPVCCSSSMSGRTAL